MKNHQSVPQIKSEEKSDIDLKREQLQENANQYKDNINLEFQNLKNNITFVLVAAGTAFLTYQAVRFLSKSKNTEKNETDIKITPPTNHKPAQVEIQQTSEKKSSELWSFIQKKAVSILLDYAKEKLWDMLQNLGKKNAEKDS